MESDSESRARAHQTLKGLVTSVKASIADVASSMIQLAKLYGHNRTVEVRFGDTILHAQEDSSVEDIRRQFETQSRSTRRLRLATSR